MIGSPAILHTDGLSVLLNGFLHTVPRSSRTQFSSLGTPYVYPVSLTLPRLTTAIPRLTLPRRSRVRERSPTYLAKMPSSSSNSASVTRLSLRSRLALSASRTITSQTPRSVLLSNVRWLRIHTDLYNFLATTGTQY